MIRSLIYFKVVGKIEEKPQKLPKIPPKKARKGA